MESESESESGLSVDVDVDVEMWMWIWVRWGWGDMHGLKHSGALGDFEEPKDYSETFKDYPWESRMTRPGLVG